MTVGKDELICYSDGEKWNVYSMEKLENVLEFPEEQCRVYTNGNCCLVTEYDTGKTNLYDHKGSLLYSMDNQGISRDSWEYAQVLEMDDGYLMGICLGGAEAGTTSWPLVWVSSDGKNAREITDPYISRMFNEGKISYGFGENVIISDWESGIQAVCSLDGNFLLEDLNDIIYPYYKMTGMYDWNIRPAIVTRKEGENLEVYDSQLRYLGNLSPDHSYPGFASGFLEGFPYEELGGNLCTDLVEYNYSQWIPCSRLDGGCLVSVCGELLWIPLEENEKLISINDFYQIIQRRDQEDNYQYYLMDRRTGDIMEEIVWEVGYSLDAMLGKNYCIIQETSQNGENSVKILDNQKQISYTSDKARVQAWKNGYILLERGIYRGIADPRGNWIARTTAGWSE